MLRAVPVIDSRWPERCDHQVVPKDKEVHWEHKYGSTIVPLHGKPGTGAEWRSCAGSFCWDRYVHILMLTFIIFRN
jgi:hypothetical protein